jgi:hypothetical protein
MFCRKEKSKLYFDDSVNVLNDLYRVIQNRSEYILYNFFISKGGMHMFM